ncbi:exopolyphosphatase PRUNE1 isoform X1 [Xenopus tropicalis]|uniref:Exopolyphosphatase PRUNE1 isoform X1 n=1 Tax=Xenopus tropicalis TaxID=8364 RepID=A0A6I8QUG7_XENTR|nr:exopolyphosphatase PRUNE1 isoform X1 [Xenopus tropicalis]|eukprot:XP_012825337.1 PREDICTED: protein prune homolog isoform X1 [Xenopus tropicalis]
MEHFLQGCKAAVQIVGKAAFHWGKGRYLARPRAPLNIPEALDFHVVLGNEACDLDSMVSAISLAYYLAKTSTSKNLAYLPVLNIQREDFPLRTESTYFLKQNGIPEGHLIFRNEIDLQTLYESGHLVLTLVDHNVLPRGDSYLEDVVAEVIDHRHLERPAALNCKVTSELVGSCTTLVAEKIIHGAPEILDLQLASLLRDTIVLDCINMAPAAGKVTPKDTEYVTTLESMFPSLPPRGTVFDSLQKAKFDVSGLTTDQMLRKDLKVLVSRDISLAISALYMKLEDFMQKEDIESDLCSFCRRHHYNVLVAMAITFNRENEPMRQIAVYSQKEGLRRVVCKALQQATNPPLDLTAIACPPCPSTTTYQQGNTAASRKKVLPILKDFLRKRDLEESSPISMQSLENPETSNDFSGFRERTGDDNLEGGELFGDCGEQPEGQDGCPGEEQRSKGFIGTYRTQLDDGLEDERSFPPTPMNSLVEGCPLDRGLPKLTAEAILERFSHITAIDSESQSGGEKK